MMASSSPLEDIEIEDDYSSSLSDNNDIGLHLHALASTAGTEGRTRTETSESLAKIKEIGFQHLDIMASERTFDGAYTRTALNALATGLLIYRVFSKEFQPIAVTYMVLGALLGFVAIYRRISSFTSHDLVWRAHPHPELDSVRVLLSPEEDEHSRMIELQKRPYEPGTSRPQRRDVFKAVTRKLETKYESGMRVQVPIDPPPNRLPEEFFKWRETKQAQKRLMMPYFVTSGAVVLVMGFIVMVTELFILSFVLTLDDIMHA